VEVSKLFHFGEVWGKVPNFEAHFLNVYTNYEVLHITGDLDSRTTGTRSSRLCELCNLDMALILAL
jgi:hypothetical protein